jgi:hypothetical protein
MIKREREMGTGNGNGKWERERDFGERKVGEIELKIEN